VYIFISGMKPIEQHTAIVTVSSYINFSSIETYVQCIFNAFRKWHCYWMFSNRECENHEFSETGQSHLSHLTSWTMTN